MTTKPRENNRTIYPLNHVKEGRTRYLTEEEIRQLLQTCLQSRSKDLYTIVLLALSSEMCRSEVLKLRWRNIDLEKEFILLTETKNDKPRIIPLEGTVWKLLKKKAQHASPDRLEIFQNTFLQRSDMCQS